MQAFRQKGPLALVVVIAVVVVLVGTVAAWWFLGNGQAQGDNQTPFAIYTVGTDGTGQKLIVGNPQHSYWGACLVSRRQASCLQLGQRR